MMAAGVLAAALETVRAVGAAAADGEGVWAAVEDPVQSLVGLGVVRLLLGMLLAVGPPAGGPGLAGSSAAAAERGSLAAAMAGTALAAGLDELAGLPAFRPYVGYRRDVCAALANMCHRRAGVQRQVVELGAVPLVLAQCKGERDEPLLREWALWAVRNLCEGSDEAAEVIRGIQAQEVVEDDGTLARHGMRVELNPETGKPRLVPAAEGRGCAARTEAPLPELPDNVCDVGDML